VTLGVLCSGQGGQHARMFELVCTAPAAQPVFAAATALFGDDLRGWVQRAAPAALQANGAAQLLCCTQALAAWAALGLNAHTHREDLVLAGYSVGELASWGCAGLIGSAEVLRLARLRAQLMEAAAGSDTGLAAIRGLSRPVLEPLCHALRCEIAIVLAADHCIVGGQRAHLERLRQTALRAGAQRYTLLPVGVAAHTSPLASASRAFAAPLHAAVTLERLPRGLRLLSGVDGDTVVDVCAGVDKLARQISQPLDWAACLTACLEAGVTRVLELGPGRALAGMAREVIPGARCRSLDEFRTLEGVRAWLTQPAPAASMR
jgi:[acyl-carrier-protein] S-malonyltransferase